MTTDQELYRKNSHCNDDMKEFKELQKENEKIRKKLNDLLLTSFSTISDEYNDIWTKINELVENEIQQEELCGQ